MGFLKLPNNGWIIDSNTNVLNNITTMNSSLNVNGNTTGILVNIIQISKYDME